jgi:hypothetical protein
MARETVITYDDVLDSIRAFNNGLEQSKRFREQIPFFQSWYYVPELDAVGPSKFIRYKDMTWLEYIRDHSELDSRVAEPVLSKWFKRLEEKSAESIWVRQRVDRLLGQYGKTVNSSSKFSAPTGWGLMGEDNASHSTNIRAATNTSGPNPQVEVFWQAFLGLSPDDQKALADRIINRKS